MSTLFKHRRAYASEWAATNPVLADGEIGIERDTGIFKVGNGTSQWSNLKPAFSDYYLGKDAKAVDSDKLDGNDSAYFESAVHAAETYATKDAHATTVGTVTALTTAVNLRELKADADTHRARTTALETPPNGHWRRGAPGPIPHAAFVRLPFDTEDVDTHGMWDAGTPDTITIKKSGIYWLAGGFGYQAPGGRRVVRLQANGTAATIGSGVSIAGNTSMGGANDVAVQFSDSCPLSEGATLRMEVYQDSGAGQNTQDIAWSRTFFTLQWQRPLP